MASKITPEEFLEKYGPLLRDTVQDHIAQHLESPSDWKDEDTHAILLALANNDKFYETDDFEACVDLIEKEPDWFDEILKTKFKTDPSAPIKPAENPPGIMPSLEKYLESPKSMSSESEKDDKRPENTPISPRKR